MVYEKDIFEDIFFGENCNAREIIKGITFHHAHAIDQLSIKTKKKSYSYFSPTSYWVFHDPFY